MKLKKKVVVTNFEMYADTAEISKMVGKYIQYFRDRLETQGQKPKKITIKIKVDGEDMFEKK